MTISNQHELHQLIVKVVLPVCLHLDGRTFYIPFKKGKAIEIQTENFFSEKETHIGTARGMEIISDEFSHFRFTRIAIKIPLIDEELIKDTEIIDVHKLMMKYDKIFLSSLNTFIDSIRIALERYGLRNYYDFDNFLEPVDIQTSATKIAILYLGFSKGPLTTAKQLRSDAEHLKIQELINNNIPLHEAFLSDAKRELYYNNDIHSLINAVISLKFIISDFITKVAIKRRIDAISINEYIKNVGLTGNIKTTLKLLVPKSTLLPEESVFSNCKSSITIRNAIMHKGRRDVSHNEIKEYIEAIEIMVRFCEKLIQDAEFY